MEKVDTKITLISNELEEHVMRKRKSCARVISFILCTSAFALAFILGWSTKREPIDYYPEKIEPKNTTNLCYRKKRQENIHDYPDLLTAVLGLCGVVLGTLVGRFTLIFEEWRHLHKRYGKSWEKMLKACFSGILWVPVIALLGSSFLCAFCLVRLGGKPFLALSYLVHIFNGICMSMLVINFLQCNTQSEVLISTILEERDISPGRTLAWSYYFNYLRKELRRFKKTITNGNGTLSTDRLLLLIPFELSLPNDLNDIDEKIKLVEKEKDKDAFHDCVYRLTVSEQDKKYFAIKYVQEPLNALREMSLLQKIKAVKRETLKHEVKVFYRTLSEILKDPPDQNCKQTCVLIPIIRNDMESLNNGGLVKRIMEKVQPSCNTQVNDASGSAKPKKSTKISLKVSNQFKTNNESSQGDKNVHPTRDTKKQDEKGMGKNEKDQKKTPQRYKNTKAEAIERQTLISPENPNSFDIESQYIK